MKNVVPALLALAVPFALIGCGGGDDSIAVPTSTPQPSPSSTATVTPTPTPTATPQAATLAGSYVGTFSATYDPRSPLSGTINSTLRFVIQSDGTVTVSNPILSDPSGNGTGTLVGNTISASGTNVHFGLRSLAGTLSRKGGQITASGTLTVASQTELASGTWQAQKQ